MGPHVQEYPVSRKDTHGSVLHFHLDRPWGHEARFTEDQLSATGFITIEVKIDETIDHLALACAHAGHIDSHGPRCDSKLPRPSRPLRNFGAMNDVFARKAGDVRTRSADQSALDHGGAPAS